MLGHLELNYNSHIRLPARTIIILPIQNYSALRCASLTKQSPSTTTPSVFKMS